MRALFLLVALLGAPGTLVAQQSAGSQPASGADTAAAAAAAAAAPATSAGEASTAGEGHAAPDSPRASLQRYLDLTREGRFDDAAAYLDLPPSRAAEGAVLARRLKSVLDHYLWFNLGQISGEPLGDDADGLGPNVEQIGVIPGAAAVPAPVRLIRLEGSEGARWVFSPSTVGNIDFWFDDLPNRWTHEYLPPLLLRPGFGDLLWWQWLALPVLGVAAWLVGLVLSRASGMALNRLAARTASNWDDLLIARLSGPMTLGWTLAVLYVLVPLLGLVGPAQDLVHVSLRVGLFLVFFWSLLRGVDVLGAYLLQTHWAVQYPASRALVPLGGRVVKAGILGMAIVGVLGEMGFSVTSLVAGLGIGGLALALAAQKTGENLFAAFSIGIDQPFRVGDQVKLDGLVGFVETIGMRSTRIRTLDRTLVTVPNGKLVEMSIESITARDRVRLHITVGLVYGTTAEQMRQILDGFERVLRRHPEIWPDELVVKFKGFGESSLDVEIMCWFKLGVGDSFRENRQDVLLQFMDVVEKAGSGFAFPTRTVHLVGGAPSLG